MVHLPQGRTTLSAHCLRLPPRRAFGGLLFLLCQKKQVCEATACFFVLLWKTIEKCSKINKTTCRCDA